MTSSKMRKMTLSSISTNSRLKLEKWFRKGEYPDSYDKIAKDTGLEKSLVKRWFFQQRSKTMKLKQSHKVQALVFRPTTLNQSMAPLPYSTQMPYFSLSTIYHSPTPQYYPLMPPYAPTYMPRLDPHHSYSINHRSLYGCFQNALSYPTRYHLTKVELDTEGKQDKRDNKVKDLQSPKNSVENSATSFEKVVTKLELCDIKENGTLAQLIDYFLGDFPSKCDSKTFQVQERPNLKSKELETAEFMAQLLMSREASINL